jgi:hypothetical protein
LANWFSRSSRRRSPCVPLCRPLHAVSEDQWVCMKALPGQAKQGRNLSAHMFHLCFSNIEVPHSDCGSPKASETERVVCALSIEYAVRWDSLRAVRGHTTPRNTGTTHRVPPLQWCWCEIDSSLSSSALGSQRWPSSGLVRLESSCPLAIVW